MASLAQSGTSALATGFGLLMVGVTAIGAHGPSLVVGLVAAVVVGVGTVFRPAATLAVLLAVLAIVVSNPSPVLAALSGLCAAAYLVSRHAASTASGAVIGSWPTTVAAVGFTFAGLVATSFPLQVPWLPLVAPVAVLAVYVLATRPFLG